MLSLEVRLPTTHRSHPTLRGNTFTLFAMTNLIRLVTTLLLVLWLLLAISRCLGLFWNRNALGLLVLLSNNFAIAKVTQQN